MNSENISKQVLEVQCLSAHAIMPVQNNDSQAGWDLSSATNCVIFSKCQELIPTDIAVAIPYGCYGRIAPRSGLAILYRIDIGAGVIDCDYRGNVFVLLINNGNSEFRVTGGTRIAQLIIEKLQVCCVKVVDKLPDTSRGVNGFGSTGLY